MSPRAAAGKLCLDGASGRGSTMIQYLVVGIDAQRYGPANVDILVQWAREGRINEATTLIETGTERELRADALPAIAAVLRPSAHARPASTPGVFVARADEPPTMTRPGSVQYPPPPPIPVVHQVRAYPVGAKSRVVAGLLGILLGSFGAHRFYLGYTGVGLLMLFLSIGGFFLFFCVPGVSCGVVHLWGIIEGVICLLGGMRDAEGRELI
jgi:TM2 domain-containing membrane protein YozV